MLKILIKKIKIFFIVFILLNNNYFYANTNTNTNTHATIPAPLFETSQRFHPEIGRNGAVATQEINATKVGLDILKQGGNAVDAAVAIGYALAVTLPRAGNLGGGGFMTIWMQKEQKAYVINYRETAPEKIDINTITQLYKKDKNSFIYSLKASGVPGTVSGLNLAAEKFGIKKLSQLIQPAINLASHGITVTQPLLDSLKYSEDRLKSDPEANKVFFTSNKLYELNQTFRQPDLANTLKLIAKYGNAGFYQGRIAKLIEEANIKQNGYITQADLLNYKASLVEPIVANYKNYKIITPPLPSAGGILLSEQLNILSKLKVNLPDNNSAEYFHYLTEIMNLTYLDRNTHLGDSKFGSFDVTKLLSQKHATDLAKKIDPKKHISFNRVNNSWNEGKNTTHYVVVDRDLNIVSNTYTLNTTYGSHKIIPGTGFFMNNELDDFTILLDEPNVYKLKQGNKNLIAPNKQPLSSMTPTVVISKNNDTPVFATGSPGGSRIITTILQVILNIIDYKQDIATAVATPRIHSQNWPDILYYEEGISIDTIEKLQSMGHQVEKTVAMGSAQTVYYNSKTHELYATADPRRAGALAMVY
ncbi:MAG: gamma-glutamyltransferase [Gammaproteobacteria bacterium]|nr:gamma-glutamyltransferase [Gammaproteobacteria bacterium]